MSKAVIAGIHIAIIEQTFARVCQT